MFYGWWLVGIAGFVILISTPFATGISAWFVVLRHGDNFPSWSAGELAWAYALTRVQTGLMGPMVGILIERFGPRRMNFLGLVISGFGFLLFSQVHELWHLYLAFLVINAGTFMGTWNAMMTALNSWFIRRKTMAMAMASEGRALGGVVLIPALVWAIDPDAERFGWRATTAGIGFFLMLIAFPLSRLVRNRPEDYGQHPDGDELPPPRFDSAESGAKPIANFRATPSNLARGIQEPVILADHPRAYVFGHGHGLDARSPRLDA